MAAIFSAYDWTDIFTSCTSLYWYSIIFRLVIFICLVFFVMIKLRKILNKTNYFVFGVLTICTLGLIYFKSYLYWSKDACNQPAGRQIIINLNNSVDFSQFREFHKIINLVEACEIFLLMCSYDFVMKIILFFDN